MVRKKILLADDMELFLEIEKGFFRREAVDILTAGSGKKALEIIRQKQPDLVFLDLYMPEGNGDEVCQELKQDPVTKSIPIIMVTSSEKDYDIRRCRDAGCDGLIHKPLKKEQFLDAAAQFLKLPKWSGLRVETQVPVLFGCNSDRRETGYMRNLSSGGLFLECGQQPAVATEIALAFDLEDPVGRIECRGRVTWRNTPLLTRNPNLPHGVGVQFLDLGTEKTRSLQSWIARQA